MSLERYVLLLLVLSFLSQLVLSSAQESKHGKKCSNFSCGSLEEVRFPFSSVDNPECGLIIMNCTGVGPKVQFHEQGKWYYVNALDNYQRTIVLHDQDLQNELDSNHCDSFNNFTEKESPFLSIDVIETRPFFKCRRDDELVSVSSSQFFSKFSHYSGCENYDLYFYDDYKRSLPFLPNNLSGHCSVVNLPYGFDTTGYNDYKLTTLWDAEFTIRWKVDYRCWRCHREGGQCVTRPNGGLKCRKEPNIRRRVIIAVTTGGSGIIFTCMVFTILVIYRHRKRNKPAAAPALMSRSMSFDPSLKPDPEEGSIYFQTQIFTYKELDEATNHFDTNKELGDGSFGTVYHGKLRDGRIVAVKQLFKRNYQRVVEQFMNEITILSCLRHRNLVTLYGCTNRHSRELLIVYEYVPNGTVADHLHGNRADAGLLTWPIRLSIAIESADALAYLHASDIIHRDVKTNNILLDDGFHVKIADFGLSRLFPTDVTHVSTAPQGTLGYVDPEYYQCYQLNDRSDVYSFGVVLIELISSKPAVDICRHRHEINLANMAINKIHNQALHELVDPCLGFELDYTVRNTITLVAELAFRCLQQEKEMRPGMVEVFETLRAIESAEYKKADEFDISADSRLLKNCQPLSPDSVTDKWVSNSTTSNTSN